MLRTEQSLELSFQSLKKKEETPKRELKQIKQTTKPTQIKETTKTDSVKKGELGATEFLITDGNVTMKISFDGFIPELFQDEMGVILDGYFSDDIFYSDDMLVKHDNEYISEDGEVYDVENYSE